MAATLWIKNGKLLVNAQGFPILCDHCPCGSGACCLYPWPGLAGAYLYPHSDLPAAVEYLGSVWTLDPTEYFYYTEDFNPVGGDQIYAGTGGEAPDGSFWIATRGSNRTSVCLINSSMLVTDQFSNTFSVSTGGTITRVPATNLCTWTGGANTLRYNSTTYKWELNGVAKSGDQNDPTTSNYGGVTLS